MKNIKAICVSMLLALSLSTSAFADTAPGDNHSPGNPVPTNGTLVSGTSSADTGGITEGETPVSNDVTLSTLGDILWTMTSIF
ncbi:MAG: hypothetical protein QOJ88_166 [Pyrinomonadaceae bacterium]|jgi:hypothetical protein|nr:hypothetical protein [Pyrinomonadaceae bacterium]MDQ1727956.1 hypothetical protein [Pyrinomonadaceae bacterium]